MIKQNDTEDSDVISLDIDYFINLFILIENITTLADIAELKSQILKFVPIMKSKAPSLQSESLYYLRRSLSECVFVQSSILFRYIIKEVFNEDYAELSDNRIVYSSLDEIAKKLNVFDDDANKEISIDVLNAPIEKKKIGNFFSEFKSTYEYNSSLSLSLFTKVVNANLSISHFDILLLEFPEYFECINKTLNDIVNNEKTNFTRSEIFYLAIMGAASVDCDFVIKDLIRLYLLNYGEESWITNGLIVAPEELKSFGKIFNIIAFQPWKLKVDDINALGIQKNLQSFIQAIIIMTTYQRIASIVQSIRLKILSPKEIREIPIAAATPSPQEEIFVKKIYKELKKKDNSRELRQRRQQILLMNALTEKEKKKKEIDIIIEKKMSYKKYKYDFFDKYEDFDYRKYSYLFSTEFSFDSIGYYLLKEFWEAPMKDINDEFESVYNMTSHCIGDNEKIESTDYFRLSLVTYVEKIYGMCDETFDYSKTNHYLVSKEFKGIIKNITCFPDRVDFSKGGMFFTEQDKLHIVLLSSMAKQRAQLTYLAKLVNEMKNNIK